MPAALALIALDAVLVVHAARRGRSFPWAFVIVGIPGLGALAYIGFELVPAWLARLACRDTRRRIRRALDPERRYRALAQELAVTDTISLRARLAEACSQLGLFEQAKIHYEAILAHPHGAEPTFMLGKAQAEFNLMRFADTLTTLDALKARWPHFESAEGHLLYVRALEECGRNDLRRAPTAQARFVAL